MLVISLSYVQYISFELIYKLLKEIFYLTITLETVRNILAKAGDEFKSICGKIRKGIITLNNAMLKFQYSVYFFIN